MGCWLQIGRETLLFDVFDLPFIIPKQREAVHRATASAMSLGRHKGCAIRGVWDRGTSCLRCHIDVDTNVAGCNVGECNMKGRGGARQGNILPEMPHIRGKSQ